MSVLEGHLKKLKINGGAEKLSVDRATASGGHSKTRRKSYQAVMAPKTSSPRTSIEERQRRLEKSVQKQDTKGIGQIMEHIADVIGSSFDSPGMMPMTGEGNPDWDAPEKNSFVMMPINNKKSSLHGRFVILQKLPNGMYKIAEKPTKDKKKKSDNDDDDDDVNKAGITGARKMRSDKGANHHWSPKGSSIRGARSAGRSPKGSRSGAL
jgi:hypothetical protein